jgi:hypothetical protein
VVISVFQPPRRTAAASSGILLSHEQTNARDACSGFRDPDELVLSLATSDPALSRAAPF